MNAAGPSVESNATSNRKDAAKVTETLAKAAHEAVDKAAERASTAEEGIREVASGSADAVHEKLDNAKEELTELTAGMERYARENPLAAAGMAFAAGIVLTSILRR